MTMARIFVLCSFWLLLGGYIIGEEPKGSEVLNTDNYELQEVGTQGNNEKVKVWEEKYKNDEYLLLDEALSNKDKIRLILQNPGKKGYYSIDKKEQELIRYSLRDLKAEAEARKWEKEVEKKYPVPDACGEYKIDVRWGSRVGVRCFDDPYFFDEKKRQAGEVDIRYKKASGDEAQVFIEFCLQKPPLFERRALHQFVSGMTSSHYGTGICVEKVGEQFVYRVEDKSRFRVMWLLADGETAIYVGSGSPDAMAVVKALLEKYPSSLTEKNAWTLEDFIKSDIDWNISWLEKSIEGDKIDADKFMMFISNILTLVECPPCGNNAGTLNGMSAKEKIELIKKVRLWYEDNKDKIKWDWQLHYFTTRDVPPKPAVKK